MGSRFGPPVYVEDRSGEILAEALQSGVQNFFGMRRQKQQDRIAGEERTRQHGREDLSDAIKLDEAGYSREPEYDDAQLPMTGADLARALPGVDRGEQPKSEFGNALAAGFEGRPLPTVASSASPSGHPGGFNPATGTFGNPRLMSLAPGVRQVKPGLYRDESRTPGARATRQRLETTRGEHELAQALADAERSRIQGDFESAGVDPNRASLYSRVPSLAGNDPLFRAPEPPRNPVMGSPEWRAAKIEEARIRTQYGPPSSSQDPNWQITDDKDGNKVQVNPKTGEVRPVMAGGKQLQGPGSQAQQLEASAVKSMSSALDGFEQILRQTGSVIMPGVDKSTLQSAYEIVQMQAKELFRLGVLAGPDLMLMRRILNDPTSLRARAEAAGDPEEHAKRVLAQVVQVRKFIADKVAARQQQQPQQTGDINLGPQVTPADLERAKRDPEFAAFLKEKTGQ